MSHQKITQALRNDVVDAVWMQGGLSVPEIARAVGCRMELVYGCITHLEHLGMVTCNGTGGQGLRWWHGHTMRPVERADWLLREVGRLEEAWARYQHRWAPAGADDPQLSLDAEMVGA